MRGALMLSISCRHPESDAFISAKLEQGKVTGANISIKFDDEFMDCVINDKRYYQYFPIHEDINKIIPSEILNKVAEVDFDKVYSGMMEGSCFKVIKARKLWDKVIYNAWRSAEPGVMFFDEILRNTPTKPYFDKGFKPVSTNPCFTGDTLVMTEDFPEGIRIDELAKLGQVRFNVHSATDYDCDGDTVWYRELRQAIAFKTGTKEVIRLNLSNGTTVRCTPDHKFALNDGTYIEAKDSLGKLLVTYDVFTDVTVDSIESCNEVEDVYDLTVDYSHTFYIVCGKDAILVHNCGEDFAAIETSCEMLENL